MYLEFYPQWKKCRDIINGEECVKANGELYLPRASGMNDDDYKAYLGRAQFFNATGRTLDGLLGLAFRKEAEIKVPEEFTYLLKNVDGKGTPLNVYLTNVFKEMIITNWGCVLVDMPKNEKVLSQKEFEQLNMSAYLTFYKAEQIRDWGWEVVDRKIRLKYVILEESVNEKKSTYVSYPVTQYRVCELDKEGFYRQKIFNQNHELTSIVYPQKKDGKFTEIPFYFVTKKAPEKPILSDMANVNLAHFRKSADIENGAHWTGVPTPYVSGATEETEIINGEEVAKPLHLGGSRVYFLSDPSARMRYLEFSGQGCNLLRNMMVDDEERMSILGTRIISSEKKGVEAAETAKIHRAGENSILASIAIQLGDSFKDILKLYIEWSSGKEINENDIILKINTDYDTTKMTAQEMIAIVTAWQGGGIARKDLFDAFKNGEVLNSDRDFSQMVNEIENEQIMGLNKIE